MELVYLWLEKFGDKSNQEINFNQNFKFSIEKIEEENYILNLKEKEVKIPDNYFGENINNISCIIGENGSGKTSLIKEIFKIKDNSKIKDNPKGDKYILIFKDNNTWTIKSNINKHILKAEFKFDFVDIKTNLNETYIYFSNDYIPMDEGLYNNDIYNISQNTKLNYSKQLDNKNLIVTGKNYLIDTYEENLQEISKFIIDLNDFKIPYDNLKNKINKIKENGVLTYKVKIQYPKDNNEIYEKKYKEIYDKIKFEDKKQNDFLDNFILNVWKYISNLLTNIEEDILKKEILEKINIREDDELLKDWIKKQLEILEKINNDFLKDIIKYNDPLKKIIEYIEEEYNSSSTNLKVPYKNNKIFFANDEKIAYFIEVRSRFLSFNFGNFSSGEYILLYFIKEIYNLKNKILSSKSKVYIFFIEEMESFLHPEWQRRIIELLKIIADNCRWLEGKKIQFILTSHTPFLIGDLPQGNISKINDFQISSLNSNPLGTNLLDILKEQFQLESLFGEFTREKIKKYLPKKNEDVNEEELQFLIENIREPLIKNHLICLYENTAEKRKRLEKEFEKIKKALEELGDKK